VALSEFFERRNYPITEKGFEKEARWHRRGHYYLRGGYGGVRDSDLVQPDRNLNKKIFKLIEAAYPMIADSFNRRLGPVAMQMFKSWPYDTGLSRSLLGFEWEITDTKLAGSLVCNAPYAYFIREGQKGKEKGRQIARELKPEELAMMGKPPRGVTRKKWAQAIAVGSRQVDLVNYGYAIGVLRRIDLAQTRREAPRKGRRVADALVFDPGKVAADRIYDDILDGMGRL